MDIHNVVAVHGFDAYESLSRMWIDTKDTKEKSSRERKIFFNTFKYPVRCLDMDMDIKLTKFDIFIILNTLQIFTV